ncbi:Alpha/Beta hydrolase protein [Calycina marina]|uniref:Alpha/Beta hydrolase protein n=1 Tax=Calycina marina TaxID=1763456 RepID=A0A9P7Z8C0_9HELO|nr:Alpha/Beta hydrolase protein [Calycina marina]
MTPEIFTILVPQEKMESLNTKLALAEFPDELENSKWDLGIPLTSRIRLNQAPQYHTSISVDGLDAQDIHFIHQVSPVKNAIPLLFVQRWSKLTSSSSHPGSFIEAFHILPLLSQPGGPAFHIVAPSLPNYGFSEGVKKRGFKGAQHAETSSHLNIVHGLQPKFKKNPILALQHSLAPYSEAEKAGFARTKWFLDEGRGYFIEQSTKPQTLAYALNDSPPWTEEEILTWVSIYQFSRAGPGAAHRIYYETVNREKTSAWNGDVKLGSTYNPKELAVFPKTWEMTMGNVVFVATNDSGGHFYTTERPELPVRDLRILFGKGGGVYGVVNGKNGYDTVREGQTLIVEECQYPCHLRRNPLLLVSRIT